MCSYNCIHKRNINLLLSLVFTEFSLKTRSFKRLHVLCFDVEDVIYFKVLLIARLIIKFMNSWGQGRVDRLPLVLCMLMASCIPNSETRKCWREPFTWLLLFSKQTLLALPARTPVPWPLLQDWGFYYPSRPSIWVSSLKVSSHSLENDRIFISQLSNQPINLTVVAY